MKKQAHPFKSVPQVAAHFDVCPYTLYEKVRLGLIPSYRFGRKVMLDPEEVRAAMRAPTKAHGPRVPKPING
jgi:hypothetical protein